MTLLIPPKDLMYYPFFKLQLEFRFTQSSRLKKTSRSSSPTVIDNMKIKKIGIWFGLMLIPDLPSFLFFLTGAKIHKISTNCKQKVEMVIKRPPSFIIWTCKKAWTERKMFRNLNKTQWFSSVIFYCLWKKLPDWQGDKKKQILPISPQFEGVKRYLMEQGKWLLYFKYWVLIPMGRLKWNEKQGWNWK